jgi:hypothetical protein
MLTNLNQYITVHTVHVLYIVLQLTFILTFRTHVRVAGHCDEYRWDEFRIGAVCKNDDNCGTYSETRFSKHQFRHPNFFNDDRGTSEEYDLRLIQLNQPSSITPVEIDDGTLSENYVEGKNCLTYLVFFEFFHDMHVFNVINVVISIRNGQPMDRWIW